MLQQFGKSITTLIFFLLSGQAWSQPSTPPLVLRPDAPERYVVVPGDTLWGISGRYTDSPWRWPELWGMNREQIQNPHLIYPGFVILLDREKGQLTIGAPGTGVPATGVPGAAAPGQAVTRGPTGSVRLEPRVRAESLARQEIPSIPASAIEPFLTRPLVIEPDGLDKAPTIVATQADRVVLATGNTAYVRGIGDASQESWYVYRRGGPLVDPDTNHVLAYEAIYLGTAQLTRGGNPATVVLTSAVQEVGAGDKLIAAGVPQPINYAPHAPPTYLKGRVMSIYGGLGKVGEAGPQQVITVNRGKADGIEVGHVLALYSLGGVVTDTTRPRGDPSAQIKLPDERSGLAFVFRVFERVSYALIMQVTRPVNPLDVVQTP
jgi:hypothetical protein